MSALTRLFTWFNNRQRHRGRIVLRLPGTVHRGPETTLCCLCAEQIFIPYLRFNFGDDGAPVCPSCARHVGFSIDPIDLCKIEHALYEHQHCDYCRSLDAAAASETKKG